MKKRLTEAQFQEVIKGLEVGQQTIEIARGVLVDGKPQAAFVAELGLTKGRCRKQSIGFGQRRSALHPRGSSE